MKTRAIVIDDDKDTVDVYQEYLDIKGINVIGVGYNGKEAVELYQKQSPDIVLLDVMMPEYDGFFALSNIKKLDQDSKIIMATADKTKESREKITSLDADALIYKPYEIDTVLDTINRVLDGEKIFSNI